MKCEDCLIIIDEYVDGELDERQRHLMREHIEACRACAREYKLITAEPDLFARYQRNVEVTPALWANIEARIAAEAPPVSLLTTLRARFTKWVTTIVTAPRMSPAFTFALVLFAIGLTVVTMKIVNVRETPTVPGDGTQVATGSLPPAPEQMSKSTPPPVVGPTVVDKRAIDGFATGDGLKTASHQRPRPRVEKPKTPQMLIREAEERYLMAIAMLERDIDKKRSRLDAETLTRFENAIAAIDQTIAETRRALREHPGDPTVAQYMLTAYAKKVDVLQEVAGF